MKSLNQSFNHFYKDFKSICKKKMRGSDFEFDRINFFNYNFNKTIIYRRVSYIDSPKWLKDKKSTINPKNNDYKCFQYAATSALILIILIIILKKYLKLDLL